MFYSDEILEEVMARNDIVDIISLHIQLKKKGNSYFGLCPFHSEKSPSFSVNREKQMYYCFGCGEGGNIFTFLMKYENYTFPETVKYLADRVNMIIPENISDEDKKEEDYKVILRKMNIDAGNYFYLLLRKKRGEKALKYLKKRGLTDEIIKKFALGYSDIYSNDLYLYLRKRGFTDLQLKDSGLVTIDEKGGTDKFWNRVMFPILDINNKVIGFGGRVMGEGSPKYLNSKETKLFDKKNNLYGMNFARNSKKNNIILCEGYMDVISMHQAGFTNAVASLGTAFTQGQAILIKRYVDEVIIAFDSDEAGVKAVLRAISILKEVNLSARVLDLKPCKDPDEFIKTYGSQELEKRIENSIGGFMFKIEQINLKYNQNDPESRTKFQYELAKELSNIYEPLERNNFIEAAALRYHISEKDLKDLVNQYGITGEIIKRNKEVYNQNRVENKDEDKTQKLLITLFVNKPELFDRLKDIITERDFSKDLYIKVYKMLKEQYLKNKKVMPATIINQFEDIAVQNVVASLFNTNLENITKDNEKATLIDIVKKIKSISLENQINNCDDITKMQELVKQKTVLEKIEF